LAQLSIVIRRLEKNDRGTAVGLKRFFVGVVLALTAVWIGVAQQVRRVDEAALKDAGKTGEEWISYNVNWSEQRYSTLNQISASNVNRLGLAWTTDIPASPGPPQNRQAATPLVYNGVLYSIAPWSVVYAMAARTGKEIWRQDPEVNKQVWQSRICCGVVNRGIALYGDKIIAPVVDGRLRALEVATSKILWETWVSPENMPYTITMAPRVIKGGKVIIGVSGGEYGVRGFFSAYDAEAAKTWSGEWWKIGGGAPVWNGMAYDADADIVYVGTGQPGPWTEVHRGPGDNLYSDCILACAAQPGSWCGITGGPWRRLGLRLDCRPDARGLVHQRQDAAGHHACTERRILLRAGPAYGRAAIGRPVGDGDLGFGSELEDRTSDCESGSALRNEHGERDAGSGRRSRMASVVL
jgi:glucose dehydrogenase